MHGSAPISRYAGTSFGPFDSPQPQATRPNSLSFSAGTIAENSWALQIGANNRGKFIGYVTARESAVALDVVIANDGAFSASGVENRPAGGAVEVSLSGQITGGIVSGRLDPLGITFSGAVDGASGPAQPTP